MGIMVYSLLWVMQDLYHQPYFGLRLESLGFISSTVSPCCFAVLQRSRYACSGIAGGAPDMLGFRV